MAECFITRGNAATHSSSEQVFTFDENGLFKYLPIVRVPNTVTNLSTSSIRSFNGHTEIETIIFDDGSTITSLGNSVFQGCSALKSIKLPDTISQIGSSCFQNCTSLEMINLPLCDLGGNAFRYCENLATVNLTQGTAITGSYTFGGCNSITNECLQDILSKLSETKMNTHTFAGCKGITNVETNKIGNYMFTNCTSLNSAIITGHKYASSPSGVFSGCTSLSNVSLSNITGLGTYYFQNCTALTSLILPSSITATIVKNVFIGCSNLSELSVEDGWNCSCDFSELSLSESSIQGIFNNLADLTDSTTKTLTLGTTNLLKVTDEQKAIATNKNWTLA